MKKIFMLFLAMTTLCFLTFSSTTVLAADLVEKYRIEFTTDVVYSPALILENVSYSASLYNSDDIEMDNPLTTNFHDEGYSFNSCGDYKVIYFIEDLQSGNKYEKLVLLEICDTTAPDILLTDIFVEYAEVGEKILVPSATASDLSSEEINVSIKVFLKDVEYEIKDNSFVPQETGEYSFVYSARDIYENEKNITYKVIVFNPSSNSSEGGGRVSCSSSITGDGFIVVFCIIVIGLGTLVFRRKKG